MEQKGKEKKGIWWGFWLYSLILVTTAIAGTLYCVTLKYSPAPPQVGSHYESVVGEEPSRQIDGVEKGQTGENGEDIDLGNDDQIPLSDPTEK